MAVREGMLVLLAEQPRHGYELKTEFERRTGTLWQLNTGQVYTTLERLQRDGLVEQVPAGEAPPSTDERRRPYRLTADGKDAAQAWLDAQAAADAPPRDELIMKILLAAHGELDVALQVVAAHRHTLLARLQEVRRDRRAADGEVSLAERLCDDVLVVRLEADLRWLDLCADRLRAHHAPPEDQAHVHDDEHDTHEDQGDVMTSEPVLELSSITCSFADGENFVAVLDDVSVSVHRGRMVAVMGPSGSGKSTLLHVACGLVSPTGGALRILGEQPPRSWARRRLEVGPGSRDVRTWWARLRRDTIGVVHQRLNLMPALSAIDNVALPLRLEGTPRAAAGAAAEQALAEVEAADLARATIDRLSTGQQQRIALARAIVGERSLILADEPTAALDTVGAEQVTTLLARLAAGGRAVLMVTHDSRLATWADEVVVLHDGRVVDRVGAHDEHADNDDDSEVAVP